MREPIRQCFFRIAKLFLCLALLAGVGLNPTAAQAIDSPTPDTPLSSANPKDTTTAKSDTPTEPASSEDTTEPASLEETTTSANPKVTTEPAKPKATTEPSETSSPESPDPQAATPTEVDKETLQDTSDQADVYTVDTSASEQEPQIVTYSAPNGEQNVAVNDSTDTKVYLAFTTTGKPYYSSPSSSTSESGYWPANTQLGFYHWDSAGRWLTATIGDKRIFFTPDGLDILPINDSPDDSSYRFLAMRNTNWYQQPNTRAKVIGSFPQGRVAQCRPLDGAGNWYYASADPDTIFYFRAADIEVLPNWTATDRTAHTGITINTTTFYAYPSTRASRIGSWQAGTILGFVNYADGWYTAMMGDQRVYFQSATIWELIANDTADRSVYSAVTTTDKPYYLTTSTDTPVRGTWGKGTILGYFHWDKSGKWLTASIGGQRIFFTPDGLDTLPKRTSSDRTAYTLRSLAEVPYYNAPSTNALSLGTFSEGISLGGIYWDDSWMYASMGTQTVYFRVTGLAYDLAASSPAPEHGLAFENVPYFSKPDARSEKLGTFTKGTHLGFVRYDLVGNWYTATMGAKGRVYFDSRHVAKLPEQNHRDRSSHIAYATSRVPYYVLPSTHSFQSGSFNEGTRLGFVHWDSANQWYWAHMGDKTVYFESKNLDVLPDRDYSSVTSYLSYALADVPYYSDVYTKSRKLGVFPKGSMPGFVRYDLAGNWYTASMGSAGSVYFQARDLAIIPPNNANDSSARLGKTTSPVTYYEAPTTRSASLGSWETGTNLGFFRWDASNQWYWAYLGDRRIYFPAASIRKSITPETVINIARNELGTLGGWKYLNAAYGPNYYVAWCATFQWWVFHQAGASDLFYGGGISPSPLQILNYYRSMGQEVFSPKPGDLVFMSVTAHASHIGLVTAVSGDKIRIAEGNWGRKVNERWIDAWGGSGQVVAYARPNY